MFSGTSTGKSYQYNENNTRLLFGDVTIPNGHPAGWYDLEVWDYSTDQYLSLIHI